MTIIEIWQHHEGYSAAVQKVIHQTTQEDIKLLLDLYGTDNLRFQATPEEIKQEALRQLEIEFRSKRIA